ncbi:MAG TPA: c-type cytochrome [Chitinophagaceae bacterium]|jgi:cytochrome c|nr:c-type cytochrome [Chitinophagaceae bacterium]OPZ17394.1 MAG: Cytochrome c-551 [Bacteroidetes bacterium ADurb.BinA245]HMW66000.1 c-type cytochrome [Chitinophagaceae bacterium]HNA18527.1 c-type cytochrome [Chitinophagaceae bacterium]HNA91536.1 c-type cytochrome [Chitinophagaceae bacterium]
MKKTLALLGMVALLASCGGGKSNGEGENAGPVQTEPTTTETTTTPSNDPSSNPDYQKGMELIAKSDCLTCHKVDEKLIGPAYSEVAAKYAGTPDTMVNHLAHKIIAGGQGNWGEVPMTAHPTVSEADAEAMVKYILLLKK